MADLWLPGGIRVPSKTTGGKTYVKVRLLREFRGMPAGHEVVCDRAAGERMADNLIGAILYEDPTPKKVVVQGGL